MGGMDSTLNERVAEEIRVQLARKNITATELARRAGMTQRSISRRITGEKVIDMEDLERIAKALEVPIAKLLPEGSMSTKTTLTRRLRAGAVRTIVPSAEQRLTGRIIPPPNGRPAANTFDHPADAKRRLERLPL